MNVPALSYTTPFQVSGPQLSIVVVEKDGAPTDKVNLASCAPSWLSLMVYSLKGLSAVGVPLITPVTGFKDNPAGKAGKMLYP